MPMASLGAHRPADRRSRSGWLPALLFCVVVPALAEAAPAGILPAAGPPAVTGGVDAALSTELAARGAREILPAATIQARLKATPEIAMALRLAEDDLRKEEEAELGMNRTAAVNAARRAIERLTAVKARYYAAEMEARAWTALGLALLLRPGDPTRARQAFRVAFSIRSDHRPNPDRTPPPVIRLLDAARAEAAAVAPPTEPDLAWLAHRARVGRLAWVGLDPRQASDGVDATEVALLVFEVAGGRAGVPLGRRRHRSATSQETAAFVLRTLAPAADKTLSDAPASPRAAPASPWYRRWWVWTLVGVAVAGASAGIAAAATRGSAAPPPPPAPSGYEFHFHF